MGWCVHNLVIPPSFLIAVAYQYALRFATARYATSPVAWYACTNGLPHQNACRGWFCPPLNGLEGVQRFQFPGGLSFAIKVSKISKNLVYHSSSRSSNSRISRVIR